MVSRWLIVVLLLSTNSANAVSDDGPFKITPDVVYGHKDGMALTYDVITPKKSNGKGLIFMVSGGWVSRWSPPKQLAATFLRPLLNQGYTVFAVRHGSSPRYVIPEIAGDIRKALEHIGEHAESYSVDREQLGVFGFSAGGHLSLLLGTQSNHRDDGPRVAAVVAVFPPTDLAPYVELGNPLREQFPALKFEPSEADKYSPLKHVSSDDAPSLMIHGDKDELVPIWHSQKIAEAFSTASVENALITIEDAGHGFDAKGMTLMYENMAKWFDRHLQDN